MKGYFVSRIVMGLALWGALAFGFEPAFRYQVIATAERVLGGRVDLDFAVISPRSSEVTLRNVRVGSPSQTDRNLLEFDALKLRFAPEPLSHRRYVVEEGSLEGLAWNTPRPDSGAVDGWTPRDTPHCGDLLADFVAGVPQHSDEPARAGRRDALVALLQRVREVSDPNQLESYRLGRAMESSWPDRFRQFNERIQAVGENLDGLREITRDAGSQATTEESERIERIAEKLSEEIDRIRVDMEGLPEVARDDFARLNAAKDRDRERLRQKIEAVPFDAEGLTELLLGPELERHLGQAADVIRGIHSAAMQIPAGFEPASTRGVEVAFGEHSSSQRWLLKKLSLAGEMDVGGAPLKFTGALCDVASNPEHHNRPATLVLEGTGPAPLHLTAKFKRNSKQPRDEIEFLWKAPQGAEVVVGRRDSLALRVVADQTEWRTKFVRADGHVDVRVSLKQSPAHIELPAEGRPVLGAPPEETAIRQAGAEGSANTAVTPLGNVPNPATIPPRLIATDLLGDALAPVLQEIGAIDASLEFAVTDGKPGPVTISSNLGAAVADGLKARLVESLDARRAQLVASLDSEILHQSTNLRILMGQRYAETRARLDVRQKEAQGLVQELAEGTVEFGEIKQTQDTRNAKSGDSRPAKAELPRDPKKVEHIRTDVRDLRNEFKTLRNARNLIRK